MNSRPRSSVGLLAHALRLVDLELLLPSAHHAELDGDPQALVVAALSRGWVELDESAAADAWRESVDATRGHPTDRPSRPTLAAFAQLAEALIEVVHRLPRLRAGVHLGHEILRWNDPDLLAVHEVCRRVDLTPGGILAPSALRWHPTIAPAPDHFFDVLGGRCADLHVHLGSTSPPALLWSFVLAGAMPIEAVVRRQEGSGPRARERGGTDSDDALAARWRRRLERAQRAFARLVSYVVPGAPAAPATVEDPAAPATVEDSAAYVLAALRHLDRVWRPRRARSAPRRDEHGWLGPLEGSMQAHGVVTGALAFERVMVGLAVRVQRRGALVPAAERDLLEYVRFRNAWFAWLSHRPGARGLGRFERAFGRRAFYFEALPARRIRQPNALATLERTRMAQAVRLAAADAAGGRLRAPPHAVAPTDIELRVTLPNDGRALVAAVYAWAQGVAIGLRAGRPAREQLGRDDVAPLAVGLVVHAIKRVDADVREAEHQWELLHRLRSEDPHLRELFVGWDCAGGEIGTSPRNYRALYRRVRRDVAALPPHDAPTRFGRTYHAGEDFRDLLSGLRAVDEAVHQLDLRPGDRVGHGLALTWPPDAFYGHRRGILVPCADRILDLLWLVALLRADPDVSDGFSYRVREWLEDAVRHAREFADAGPPSSAAIEDALHALDLDGRLPDSAAGAGSWLPDALLGRLGVPEACGRRLVPVWGESDPVVPLVERAQRLVRARVRRRGVHIEACPTSNLLIGDFGSYARLPYLPYIPGFPFPPTSGSRPAPGDTLSVVFCTDNPAVMGTTLRQEYQRVGRALVEAGADPQAVQAWLRDARKRGVSASFLSRRSPRGWEQLEHLERCSAVVPDSEPARQ